MTSGVPERRRSQRVTVGASSWLALPTSWSVGLLDIGMAGLSFASSHPLDIGRTVFVSARLDGEAFNGPIQVCWCRLKPGEPGRPQRYEVGGTFQQVEENSRRTLWRFLRMTTASE